MEAPQFYKMKDNTIAKKYLNKIQDAQKRKIEFTLSFAQFKRLCHTSKCFYTGTLLTLQTGPEQKHSDLTLDRVDSSKGYVPGNVVACCNLFNNIKSTFENPSHVTMTMKTLIKATKKIEKVLKENKKKKP